MIRSVRCFGVYAVGGRGHHRLFGGRDSLPAFQTELRGWGSSVPKSSRRAPGTASFILARSATGRSLESLPFRRLSFQ
jgi:hypothetical protein